MIKANTKISVLEDNIGKYVMLYGVAAVLPHVPVRVESIEIDKLVVRIDLCNDNTAPDSIVFKLPLKYIYQITDAKEDNVLWESDEDNWRIKALLRKPMFKIECDLQVDSRLLHIKGYIDDIKYIDGSECIHVHNYHDGVWTSSLWLELSKLKNIKLGGIK